MRPAQWQTFTAMFAQLSQHQRHASIQLLSSAVKQEAVVMLIEQTAHARAPHLTCPACHSPHCHRHGQANGLQRYRCVSCGRTFNSLTGTPLSRLRHKSQWLDYAACMLDSFTVRKAAAQVEVHRNTSFRWRHRFLALARTDRPLCLHGIVEADEMFLLESEKGARHLLRPARKRGGHASKRGISDEHVCILVARDRTGQTRDFVTGRGQLTPDRLHTWLKPVIDPDVLLVTDGHTAYRAFARDTGISHEAVNLRAGVRVRGAAHVQNVNAYHSRLRQWLAPFHGVATRYLPNYLGWRWILDAKRIRSANSLLKAALGEFPHLTVT